MGIAHAIHTFAGVQLRLACAEIMQKQGHEEPAGRAKLTEAYNLPCQYVLHTVGPVIFDRVTETDRQLLASCYRSCLELAEANHIKSVAFCCISTGEFRFPNRAAAEIAVQTVRDFQAQTGSEMKVIFNYSKTSTATSTGNFSAGMEKLKAALQSADAVVIGAGAGLSTSAGFVYTGERFEKYFGDFATRYGFQDMYSGGFYPYETPEEHWAYWSRYIWINRYMDPPRPVYNRLFELVKDKDFFVLTTNVDHCFQKEGFAKERLFYTQGDYGLFQCSRPCDMDTWDNFDTIRRMVQAQGFSVGDRGELLLPAGESAEMRVPTELLPVCPKCGSPLTMNLRAGASFVEDEGWLRAADRYSDFIRNHRGKRMLFLELGVGFNTPGIIKYSFWQMTAENPLATCACINLGQAACPDEIAGQAICLDGDIGAILEQL